MIKRTVDNSQSLYHNDISIDEVPYPASKLYEKYMYSRCLANHIINKKQGRCMKTKHKIFELNMKQEIIYGFNNM